MALTTTDQVLTDLNIQDGAQGVRIDLIRRQAEAAIKSFVKWDMELDTVTDYYDGTNYPDIYLRRPFVASVANVWEDFQGYYGQGNNAFSGNPLVSGNDYCLVTEDTLSKCGILRRTTNNFYWGFPSSYLNARQSGGLAYSRPAVWNRGYGNYKVTYTYGWPPATISTAASWSGGVITYTTPVAHGFP